MTGKLIRNYSARPGLALSPRQVTIMRWVIQGYTTRDIAHEMGLRPRTIESHIAIIKARLEAKNLVHAAVLFDRAEREQSDV